MNVTLGQTHCGWVNWVQRGGIGCGHVFLLIACLRSSSLRHPQVGSNFFQASIKAELPHHPYFVVITDSSQPLFSPPSSSTVPSYSVSNYEHSGVACIGLNREHAFDRARSGWYCLFGSFFKPRACLIRRALPLIVCTSLLIMLVDIPFGWYVEHNDESAWNAENGRLGVPVLYPVMPFSIQPHRG